MKIAVLMWYDDKIKHYADNFYKINLFYCQKNNYTLIKSSTRRYNKKNKYQKRKEHWERFPLILKHIENYDYVVWIDADAFFYMDALPIENIINKYRLRRRKRGWAEREIFLSYDHDAAFVEPHTAPSINSGVIILKNTQRVKDIVEKWAFCEELRYKYKTELHGWIEDQAVVRGCYKDNVDYLKSLCVVIPYLELQHCYAEELNKLKDESVARAFAPKKWPYIYHLAGQPKKRVEESEDYLKKNKDLLDLD
jgi:hypothetical protein